MKKIISLTLTIMLVMSALFVFPASASAVKSSDGEWVYHIMDDNNLRIYAYKGTETNLTIPDAIDGHKVTRVLTLKNTAIKSVKLGKNIENFVALSTVRSDNFKKFIVDNNNKNYKSANGLLLNKKGNKLIAYPGGISAKTLKLPKTVTYIGSGALAKNKHLTKVTIPGTVKRIGSGAFTYCSALTSVKISKSVKLIDSYAFSGNKKLTSVTFDGSGAYSLQGYVFELCSNLKTVKIPNIKYNKTGKYTGKNMFVGCEKLGTVKFAKNAAYVPYECFEGCEGLKSVTIPATVKTIGKYAFACTETHNGVEINNSFVIKGVKGSAAETYAKANKLKFKAI